MRISDWSSDVCSSDLRVHHRPEREMGFRLDQVVRVEIALADVISADGEPIRIKGSQLAGTVARHTMHHLGGFFAKDRKSVASGKSVSVRVDIGGRRLMKKKTIIT